MRPAKRSFRPAASPLRSTSPQQDATSIVSLEGGQNVDAFVKELPRSTVARAARELTHFNGN